MAINNDQKVAILLHQGIKGPKGKTGLAYLRYAQTNIVAVIDSDSAGESLPQLTKISRQIPIVAHISEALSYQPEILVIGIAPSGGLLPDTWLEEIKQALKAGLSIVNGLHTPLAHLANNLQPSQWIWDIRQEPPALKIATGQARSLSCQRILTVGTDMSVGKMSTTIELHRAAIAKGIKAKFLATGQGGIMIAGEGIPLDAVRVDFAAGAVENLVLEFAKDNDLLLIEGQGSLLHPGSTATLPLIRGSQPTGLILVHRASQQHIHDLPDFQIPPLKDVVELYEKVATAAGTFAPVKVKAIALNTFTLDEIQAKNAIEDVKKATGLPCSDVVRFGCTPLLEAILP